MGKKDITLKNYLSDTRRYADLLNGSIFQGKQVIHAEELQEAATVRSKSDHHAILERTNDIAMKQTQNGYGNLPDTGHPNRHERTDK